MGFEAFFFFFLRQETSSCTEIKEATVFNIESYRGTDYEFEKIKDARLGASLGAWDFCD